MFHDPAIFFVVKASLLGLLDWVLLFFMWREWRAVGELRPAAFQGGRLVLATRVTLSGDPRGVPPDRSIETPTGRFMFTARDHCIFTARIEMRKTLGVPSFSKAKRFPFKGEMDLYGRTAEIGVKSLLWTDVFHAVHFVALPLIFAEYGLFAILGWQVLSVIFYFYYLRRMRRDALAIVQEMDANLTGAGPAEQLMDTRQRFRLFRVSGPARAG